MKMNNTDLERIGVFFFLSLMDEYSAVLACQRASFLYKRRLEQKGTPSSIPDLVEICQDVFLTGEKKKTHGALTILSDAFQWPTQIDPTPWREFYRNSSHDQRAAVIWMIVLKLDAGEIAKGLSVSAGSLRYRTGSALALLGKLTRPSLRGS